MTKSQLTSQSAGQKEERLADLLEEITQTLAAGELVDLPFYQQRYPEFADQLREIVPAVEVLESLGLSAGKKLAENAAVAERLALGDFRIIREIGRGGMGLVYEAEQLSLHRRVALKVLPFAAVLDERSLKRFKNEAIAAAALDHANIVSVFSVGCERGAHYYAMELVDGKSLAQLIDGLRERGDQGGTSTLQASKDTEPIAALSTQHSSHSGEYHRSVARLGIQAAEALEYAHEQGIVHRDIKPSNLLLDHKGKLWISDFGLAQIQGDHNLTMSGDVLGTLRYMSPEQAEGTKLLDHRTDIYSLGVTLYELLTLRPAFAGRDRQKLLREIGELEPPAPRGIDSAIPRDLETIVLKAAAKEAHSRYGTAREVAEDLQRFLEDIPIRARRPSLGDRAAKWSRRHRPIVWSAAAILIVAIVALSVSTVLIARQRMLATDAVDELLDHVQNVVKELADARSLDRIPGFSEYASQLNERLPQEIRNSPRHRSRLASIDFHHGRCAAWWREHDVAEGLFRRAIAGYEGLPAEMREKHELELALFYYHLGKVLEEKNEPVAANRHYRQFLQLIGKTEVSHLGIEDTGYQPIEVEQMAAEAAEHLRQRDLDEAIRIAHIEVTRHPDESESRRKLGDAYRAKGRLDEALAEYTTAIKHDPRSYLLHLCRGNVWLENGKIDLAIDSWSTAIDLNPKFDLAYAMRAYTYFSKGDFRTSARDYDKAIELNPTDSRFYVFRGYIHYLAGDYGQAEDYYTRAVQIGSKLAPALAARGDLYGEMGKWELALADYDEAIRVAPDYDFPYCGRALARARLGQEEGARDDLAKTVNLPKQRGQWGVAHSPELVAWFLATCPEVDLRRPQRAASVARQGLEIWPEAGYLLATLGVAQYRAGNWVEARGALEKSAIIPTFRQTAGQFFLAMTYWQLGDEELALRAYNKAVEQMEQNRPYQQKELGLFRDEAAALLGVNLSTKKKAPTESQPTY